MHIAFPLIDKHVWRGGYNYLLNLFSALEMPPVTDIQPILFAGQDVHPTDLEPFQMLKQTKIVTTRVFNRSGRLRRQFLVLATGRDAMAEELFSRYDIEVVFENARFFGKDFKFPVIAWLPDFQHRHLPHMFSRFGYWKRELGFRRQVTAGRCILLSSQAARQDLVAFYPAYGGIPFVIPFAVEISPDLLTEDPDDVRRRYRLPEDFFYLPNQFYQHKNHDLLLSALKLTSETGTDIVIAASGNTRDPRAPKVIERLNQKIQQYRLARNFRFLGSIPYRDVIGLIRSTAALVNPSLFEGWSTTVEEAKALGVPMILSDLPVHREQAPEFATYFNRHSPESLAAALTGFAGSTDNCRDLSEKQALAAVHQRRKVFAQQFAAMAFECAARAQ